MCFSCTLAVTEQLKTNNNFSCSTAMNLSKRYSKSNINCVLWWPIFCQSPVYLQSMTAAVFLSETLLDLQLEEEAVIRVETLSKMTMMHRINIFISKRVDQAGSLMQMAVLQNDYLNVVLNTQRGLQTKDLCIGQPTSQKSDGSQVR